MRRYVIADTSEADYATFPAEMEPGHGPVTGSPVQRFWSGRVGPRVSVSDPMFYPVLSFNMRVYRDVVSTE